MPERDDLPLDLSDLFPERPTDRVDPGDPRGVFTEEELRTAFQTCMSDAEAHAEAATFMRMIERGIPIGIADATWARLRQVSDDCARRVDAYIDRVRRLAN